jgi:cytochrome P450
VKSAGIEHAPLRPPAPVPLEKTPGSLRLIRGLRASPIACFTKVHYELPVVLTRSFLGTIVVVNDANGIRHVLADNAANYRKDNLWQRMLAPAIGQGLLTNEGEQWRAQRHLIASLFTSRMINGFAPAMAAAANATVKQWLRHDHCRLDIAVEMARVVIAVLEHTLFSDGIGLDPDEFARAATHYLDRMGRLDPLDVLELPGWLPRLERLRARPALAVFDRAVATLVERRRTLLARHPDSAPNDLLTTLLTAGERTGQGLNNAEIRANIITFILAGYESTANALTCSLFLLSLAPHWRERIEAEVDRELPDGCYAEGSLQRLVVTRAVLEEAMRLYPPVPIINRQAIGPDRLRIRILRLEPAS